MIGIVIAAHDHLADALQRAANSVLGEQENMVSIAIDPSDGAPDIQKKFEQAIRAFDAAEGVLILTDMFGGTPSNIGLTMHKGGKVEVLTGVNLPMVIKAAQLADRSDDLAGVARSIRDVGVSSITVASDLLGKGREGGHE